MSAATGSPRDLQAVARSLSKTCLPSTPDRQVSSEKTGPCHEGPEKHEAVWTACSQQRGQGASAKELELELELEREQGQEQGGQTVWDEQTWYDAEVRHHGLCPKN